MIVCVTTSATLMENILSRAGDAVTNEYINKSKSEHDIILNGGHTKAKWIVFVPWQQEVHQSHMHEAEKVI